MMELYSSERDIAVTWILIGAIFFAMRSYEYLKTADISKKRTRIVTVRNIVFKKKNSVLDHDNPYLGSADLVQIQFCVQKNDKQDVCIHMFNSGDSILCPVEAWTNTVQRVRKYQDPLTSQK